MTQEACATIKKANTSIDTLLEGYAPQEPEERQELETAETGRTIAELADRLLKGEEDLSHYIEHSLPKALKEMGQALTPAQIAALSLIIKAHENRKDYCDIAGWLITALIQESYNAGHNDFQLDTTDLKPIHNIGYLLKGTEENPIRVTIIGNTGNYCGKQASNIELNMTGTAGNHCGNEARESTFQFATEGYWCAQKAMHCTFKTTDEETLACLIKHAPEENRIIFVHEDDTEETVRDYHAAC